MPHFFCELNQMVQLSCSDIFLNNLLIYFGTGLLGGGTLAGIFYSYFKVVSSICGMSSAQGKFKAFSTCASHLSAVSLFYCTSISVYLSSATTPSSHSGAAASVMYTVVTPMLNPFIYSLRNKDIKGALKRFIGVETIKGLIGQGWRSDHDCRAQSLWEETAFLQSDCRIEFLWIYHLFNFNLFRYLKFLNLCNVLLCLIYK